MNTEENKDTQFKSLVSEDKYLVKAFMYENGTTLSDNLISRIYQQENGKFCLTISSKSKIPSYKEDIIYYAENMEDEGHINTLMAIDTHIYTRYGWSYKFLTFYSKPTVKLILWVLMGIVISSIFFK